MRIRKPIPLILVNPPWLLVALAVILLGLMTALGIGAAQHPAAPEPAAPQPTLAPPEPLRPAPRGPEITVQVEAIAAPEPLSEPTAQATAPAEEPPVQYQRRRLFRRRR